MPEVQRSCCHANAVSASPEIPARVRSFVLLQMDKIAHSCMTWMVVLLQSVAELYPEPGQSGSTFQGIF